MKKVILLLTVVILFKPLWPLIEYANNYDYIVENLCVNKNKPMLNCNGKCFLAKKIAQESKEKGENPFNSLLSKFESPIINWITMVNMSFQFLELTNPPNSWVVQKITFLFTNEILDPPRPY